MSFNLVLNLLIMFYVLDIYEIYFDFIFNVGWMNMIIMLVFVGSFIVFVLVY